MSKQSSDWLSLLPQVETAIVEQGIPVPGWRSSSDDHRRFQDGVARLLVQDRLVTDDAQVVNAAGILARASTGLGVLDEYLTQPGIEEIIVRSGHVQI